MNVPEIEVSDLEERLANGATVLDVREEDEVLEARIPGVLHIPMMEIPSRMAELPSPLYVVCASGGRSHKTAEFLLARGVDATNVAGGTKAWLASGRSVESGPMNR